MYKRCMAIKNINPTILSSWWIESWYEVRIRKNASDGHERKCLTCTHTNRDFIKKEVEIFAKANEQIQIQVQTMPGKHPLCIGQYLNENEKTIDVPNKSTKDILHTVNFLRNQSGRAVHAVKKNQVRVLTSLQGEWKPDMEWPSEFKVTHH